MKEPDTHYKILKEVCAPPGTQASLARHMGVRRQAVNDWIKSDFLPANRWCDFRDYARKQLLDISYERLALACRVRRDG